MTNAKNTFREARNVTLIFNVDTARINNKAVACFNLALAFMHTDDTPGMLQELSELECFLTPEMNVYKNLLQTGFDQLLFRNHFLDTLQILEEMLFITMHDKEPFRYTDEEIKSSSPQLT